MDTIPVSGIVGATLGLVGGLIGTYFSIKNSKTPRQRRVMIKAAVACWVALGLMAAAVQLFPSARWWIGLAFVVLLPPFILYVNRIAGGMNPQ